MSTFAKLAELPIEIESCHLQGLARSVPLGERLSTVVRLLGRGEEGVGEDVIVYPPDQQAFQQAGAPDLTGSWTLAELGDRMDSLDLFAVQPLFEAYRDWRRWAFHSAALDLALRQAGRALHEVLEVQPQPMTFVLSTSLGEPPHTDALHALLARYPDARLKLDVSPSWDDRLLAELAALDAVDTVDFKGYTPIWAPRFPLTPHSIGVSPRRCQACGWRTRISATPRLTRPLPPIATGSPGTSRCARLRISSRWSSSRA